MEYKTNKVLANMIVNEIGLAREAINQLKQSGISTQFSRHLEKVWRHLDWVLDCIGPNKVLLELYLVPLVCGDITSCCAGVREELSWQVRERNYSSVSEPLDKFKEFLEKMLKSLQKFAQNRMIRNSMKKLRSLLVEVKDLQTQISQFGISPQLLPQSHKPEQKRRRRSTSEQSLYFTVAGIFLTNPQLGLTHPTLSILPPPTRLPQALQEAKDELISLLVQFVFVGEKPGKAWEQALKKQLQVDVYQLFDRARRVIDTSTKQIKLFLQGQLPQQFAGPGEFKAAKSFQKINQLLKYLLHLSAAIEKIAALVEPGHSLSILLEGVNRAIELTKQLSLFSSSTPFAVPAMHPLRELPPMGQYSLFPQTFFSPEGARQEIKDNKSADHEEIEPPHLGCSPANPVDNC